MTKSYHINELTISLILLATVKSLNYYFNFLCASGSLPFIHQAPHVEKESGSEGEEDIRDS